MKPINYYFDDEDDDYALINEINYNKRMASLKQPKTTTTTQSNGFDIGSIFQFGLNTMGTIGGNLWDSATRLAKQPKAFMEKGIDLNDIPGTLGRYYLTSNLTSFDAGKFFVQGAMGTLESTADTLQYMSSDTAKTYSQLGEKLFGKNIVSDVYAKYGDWVKKNAQFDSTGALVGNDAENSLFENLMWVRGQAAKKAGLNKTSEIFNKLGQLDDEGKTLTQRATDYSALGQTGEQVFEGLGNIAMMAAEGAVLGSAVGAVPGMATAGQTGAVEFTKLGKLVQSGIPSFMSGYGNARTKAYEDGASDEEARKYATINGLAEAISEQFFDAMPGIKSAGFAEKLSLKNMLGDRLEKSFGSNVGRLFLKFVGGLEEGSEEVISNLLVTLGSELLMQDQNYQYNPDNLTGNAVEDLKNTFLSQESWDAFFSAMLSSALLGGGEFVKDTARRNQLTNAYAKDNGITYKEAKNLLFNQMQEATKENMNRENYESNVDYNKAAENRVLNFVENTSNVEEQVNKQLELREADYLKNHPGEEITDDIREQLRTQIREGFVDQVNNPDKYTAFKQETNNERDKTLAESMKRSGMTNTKLNHDIYNFVKTLQDNNEKSQYKFVSRQQIMDLIPGSEEKFKNGVFPRAFKMGDTIYVNSQLSAKDLSTDSQKIKYYEALIGHEMGEAIKASDKASYDDLKSIVKELYDFKESDLDSYKALYGDNLTNDVEDEWTNDKLGDLFENEQMINKIADNRNLLQKVIDEIKKFVKYITSDKEQKQFMQLQEKLENKYAELYKEANFAKKGTAFSIQQANAGNYANIDTDQAKSKDSQGKELTKEQQEYFKDSKVRDAEGRLKVMYHGTPTGGFTIFDNNQKQRDVGFLGKGFYFTSDLEDADEYSKSFDIYDYTPNSEVKEVYLNIKKPYIIPTEVDYRSDMLAKRLGVRPEQIQRTLISQGYDGIIYDANWHNEYVVFNSNQIKNVDNTNPTSNQDIRYSLGVEEANTGTDNSGKELSEGQKEYFKNSKATDENGNLKVLYHGSDTAGFYTFGATTQGNYKYNDYNEDVTFLTDRKDVSQSYTKSNEMVDTTKFNDLEEARQWVEEITGDEIEIQRDESAWNNKPYIAFVNQDGEEIVSGWDEQELLKDTKREIQKQYGDTEAGGIYQVYANITNPYIVEGKGRNWNDIEGEDSEELTNFYESLNNNDKEELSNLAQKTFDMYDSYDEAMESFYQRLNAENEELYDRISEISSIRDKIYKAAYKNWDEVDTSNLIKERLSTNDIVKKVLNMNRNGENYDGVIFKNISDIGQYGVGEQTSDVYVTFNSNQIKATDNVNPTQDSDIRYSLSQDGEMVDNNTGEKVTLEATEDNTGTLMAIHNLNESKLNGILDLGGFPVPSIAITNPDIVNHKQFGDISVIFDKETINPENRLNEVFDRDVWSPTFPTIEYDLNTKTINRVRNAIGGYGNTYLSSANSLMNNIEDKINRFGVEDTIKDLKNDDNFKYVYYKTMNPDFELLTKEDTEDLSTDYSNRMLKEFADEYGEVPKWSEATSEQRKDVVDKFAKKLIPFMEERANKIIEEENAKENPRRFIIGMAEQSVNGLKERMSALGWQDKLLENLNRIQKEGTTRIVNDYKATSDFINENINQQEYDKWIDDLFSDIVNKKGIYNGKEIFTASGNRRTFNQLHEDYNLQNLVKILTNQDTIAGEQGFGAGQGFGTIQAKQSNRFNSIQDIKDAESRITSNSNEVVDQLREVIGQDMEQLNDYQKIKSEYSYVDSAGTALNDFAAYKNLTMNNLNTALENNNINSKNVPIELKQKIINDIESLKTIPTDYFEAKPQRAVGINEIGAVVIPNNTSEEFKQRLRDNNIEFTEYNPEIEGDRQRAINEYEQYKFSLGKQEANLPTILDTQFNNQGIYNLPTTTQENEELPFFDVDEPVEEDRFAEQRRKLADKRIRNMIEKQTYKSAKAATKVAKDYVGFDSNETKEFREGIENLANKRKDVLIKAKNYQQVKDLVSKFANRENTFVSEELKEAQKDVRHSQLIVSPELRNQITDWTDFRKKSGLNIKSGQKSNVDVVYQELLDSYPGMLDSTITNYADQLQAMSEFVHRDNKVVERYTLDDNTITQITNRVWEKLSQNALTKQDFKAIEDDINKQVERRTREVVQNALLEDMGITLDDIDVGKDISSIAYQRTDPKRLNEKVFGYDVGTKINDATTNYVGHQEAERTRFLNQERSDIQKLGIKARSKESAAVQKYGEKQYVNDKGEVVEYNDRDLMREFPKYEDQQRIKKAASVLRAKYDTYIDRINESLVEMGYDPIPKRQDYFKHFTELDDKLSQWGIPYSRENLNAEELSTDINGLTDQFKPGKNFFASALQRKGIKTTYDAITGIDKYLEGASNLMYHTESIQRYRTLSKFIRNTYGQTHGLEDLDTMTPEEAQKRVEDVYNNKLTRYAAWLDEQANSLAGKKGAIDRSMERFMGRKAYTFLNALKSQVGSNMTGFNVRSAMTNFASAIQGASKTNKLAMLEGSAFALKNYIHEDTDLINKSDFLVKRFGSDALSKKAWQKISAAGQVFMSATDRFTSLQIWGGKYYEGLHKGLTQEAAIKQADDFASRIMGDRSKGQTAEIFNSKTLGLLTQFQLEVNNQWSSMIHDNRMEMQKNPGLKTSMKIVSQLGQLYAASYFFNSFMKALTGSDVMFDPIDILKGIIAPPDDDDKTLEERATEAVGKFINQIPMASIFTGGRIPISEAFTGVGTLGKKLTGQKDAFGNEITWDDVKDDLIASSFYFLLPTGYGQIKKTAQGLGQYGQVLPEPIEKAMDIYHNENLPVAGNYTKAGKLKYEADETPYGKIQSALFGRNASEAAQEYREKGYQPLSEKNVKTAVNANLPISEYREIKKGITDAANAVKGTDISSTEAKADYIYNLPLNTTQKDVLIKDSTTRKEPIDMKEYGNYGSLDEYDYATQHNDKYITITQITDYDTYQTYKDEIKAIKDIYSNSQDKKREVQAYINSLGLNIYQKLMLEKMAGGYSIKNYKGYVQSYINSLDLTKEEKEVIDNELFG